METISDSNRPGILFIKNWYKTIPIQLLALSLLLWGCTRPSVSFSIKKETNTTNVSSFSSVTDSITIATDEDFESFFKKFSGDSVFQHERIKFPVKVTTIDNEENQVKWIKNKEWQYTDFIHFTNARLQQENTSDKAVKMIFMIEDTGVLIYHYFQKRDGKWTLVAIEDCSN